ncbi:MAG: hypothetical protein QOE27_515 [Solirubrobacteraceae bacterium]|nr:hypothetical protein [Solirubrobacteraceae bacterium]
MSDPVRELLADLPLANMADRPEGMLAIRRDDVPEAERTAVDDWVDAHGGRIVRDPVFKVHNGKTPAVPAAEAFYVIPPGAFRG